MRMYWLYICILIHVSNALCRELQLLVINSALAQEFSTLSDMVINWVIHCKITSNIQTCKTNTIAAKINSYNIKIVPLKCGVKNVKKINL